MAMFDDKIIAQSFVRWFNEANGAEFMQDQTIPDDIKDLIVLLLLEAFREGVKVGQENVMVGKN